MHIYITIFNQLHVHVLDMCIYLPEREASVASCNTDTDI